MRRVTLFIGFINDRLGLLLIITCQHKRNASLRNLVLLSEFGYFFSCCREMKRAIFIIIHLMSSILFTRPTF